MILTNNRHRQSFLVLTRIVSILVAILLILVWQWEFLEEFYSFEGRNQYSFVLNGLVIFVFSIGLVQLFMLLIGYMNQEKSLVRFWQNCIKEVEDPLVGVDGESQIGRRYQMMQSLYHKQASLQHGTLAALMKSELNARFSFPRFINNILILVGMLGTIVSLSIALFGASEILQQVTEPAGLSKIILAMATALSTTLTAIVCYVLFRFFLGSALKVKDALAEDIEKITAFYLVPKMQLNSTALTTQIGDLVKQLLVATRQLQENQGKWVNSQERLLEVISNVDMSASISQDLERINQTLNQGFRLEG